MVRMMTVCLAGAFEPSIMAALLGPQARQRTGRLGRRWDRKPEASGSAATAFTKVAAIRDFDPRQARFSVVQCWKVEATS